MARRHVRSKSLWKFQEAVVYLAVAEVFDDVSWNVDRRHTPAGMSIDPDILVGPTDAPTLLCFVTHGGASMAGQKKFWRTMTEIFEARMLPGPPVLFSVQCSGSLKHKLDRAYSALFDSFLRWQDVDEGQALARSLEQLFHATPVGTALEALEHVERALCDGLINGWEWFLTFCKTELVALTSSPQTAPWLREREAFGGVAKTTAFRRALCKWYALPQVARDSIVSKVPVQEEAASWQFALELGWFRRTLRGARCVDEQLLAFVQEDIFVEVDELVELIDETLPLFSEYARSLRELYRLDWVYEWILTHWDRLTDSTGMKGALRDVFDGLSYTEEVVDSEGHWLLSAMMQLRRVEEGGQDAYGYSALARELGEEEGISRGYIDIADMINRKKCVREDAMLRLAEVFSGHLSRWGRERFGQLAEDARRTTCQSIFFYKMMNYRLFQPLEWLVVRRLREMGLEVSFPLRHPSFSGEFGEWAPATGNMICVQEGACWIKCQSAYKGRVDKRKELCGRVAAMKLRYTSETCPTFLLVVDGWFRTDDLQLLYRWGWDDIFYPDELPRLIDTIKQRLCTSP